MNYDVVNRRWIDTLGRVITNPIPAPELLSLVKIVRENFSQDSLPNYDIGLKKE